MGSHAEAGPPTDPGYVEPKHFRKEEAKFITSETNDDPSKP